MVLHKEQADLPSHPRTFVSFLCTILILKSLGTKFLAPESSKLLLTVLFYLSSLSIFLYHSAEIQSLHVVQILCLSKFYIFSCNGDVHAQILALHVRCCTRQSDTHKIAILSEKWDPSKQC